MGAIVILLVSYLLILETLILCFEDNIQLVTMILVIAWSVE